jgi:hypothetical protein
MSDTKQHDPVDHPSHYTSHPSGIECIQITEHMSFNLGNAVKYIWRADLKGAALEDLKKAVWYVEREIEKRQRRAKLESYAEELARHAGMVQEIIEQRAGFVFAPDFNVHYGLTNPVSPLTQVVEPDSPKWGPWRAVADYDSMFRLKRVDVEGSYQYYSDLQENPVRYTHQDNAEGFAQILNETIADLTKT